MSTPRRAKYKSARRRASGSSESSHAFSSSMTQPAISPCAEASGLPCSRVSRAARAGASALMTSSTFLIVAMRSAMSTACHFLYAAFAVATASSTCACEACGHFPATPPVAGSSTSKVSPPSGETSCPLIKSLPSAACCRAFSRDAMFADFSPARRPQSLWPSGAVLSAADRALSLTEREAHITTDARGRRIGTRKTHVGAPHWPLWAVGLTGRVLPDQWADLLRTAPRPPASRIRTALAPPSTLAPPSSHGRRPWYLRLPSARDGDVHSAA